MANLFNSVKLFRPKTNMFDLSHDVKLSGQMGNLIPTVCLEAVPGDKFNIGCESLLRFAPLVSPMMHRVDVTMHYFFVPNRLVWPGWEDFVTNTETAGNLPAPPYFAINSSHFDIGSLADYMGIPPALGGNTEIISALPFAVYQKVYNEFYRDQNLITAVPDTLINGLNNSSDFFELRRRAWEHDYFTSALPWAQKGDAVDIPLGDVQLKTNWDAGGANPKFEGEDQDFTAGNVTQVNVPATHIEISALAGKRQAYDPDGTLETEATTINDLRRAFRLQEFLERNARGGTRYIENILAHFGVKSSDKRLQRPEYITGTKSPVTISEVLNTTGETLPQGNMAGHGISVTQGKYGYYRCEEHGFIIGIMSVMPKPAYMQGIHKMFYKIQDPFQYYWPTLANIGEQEIQNKEVFAWQGTAGNDTFGYTPRYAEYKYMPSRACGQFRTTLDYWHMARLFASAPSLNAQFVECFPDTRVFAVTDEGEHKLFCHIYHKIKAVRPMPKYGSPMF